MPRPQESEGTILALEATAPAGDASREGHDHWVEEGRAWGHLAWGPP